jgi:spore maturation protein CgeB
LTIPGLVTFATSRKTEQVFSRIGAVPRTHEKYLPWRHRVNGESEMPQSRPSRRVRAERRAGGIRSSLRTPHFLNMLTIALYHNGNLVQRELISALKRVPGVRVIVIEAVNFLDAAQAECACNVLAEHNVNVLFTINDWGMDIAGVTADFMVAKGLVHLNWYVDDPFFYEIFGLARFSPKPNRIDFVSDRGYVERLNAHGFNARFLPLGCDPSIFAPDPSLQPVRNICFVGNSYREEMDAYLQGIDKFVEAQVPFMTKVLHRYQQDMRVDVERDIDKHLATQKLPDGLTFQKAAFVIKHFVGYLFRKRVVVGLARRHPDFMVFGDDLWVQDLPAERVSMAVGYYINLSKTYQETRVNIDINRMVIRDGFTQRVFDCLSAGAFVITSPKRVVGEYFEISGPNQELVVFQNEDHLRDLVKYYLGHEDQRRAIAQRGREKVLAGHTYDCRVREVFAVLRA